MSCRVLFINRSYWPDSEATGQLLTELCEDLASTGEFDVHVLCGMPNHISGDATAAHSAEGVRNGVTIHRATHSQFSKRSIIGKLINLMTFTLSAWWKTRRMPKPDVVVTETDPFFVGLLGRRMQSTRGCRFVAYLQDIYPDVAVAVGKAREGTLVRQWRRILFRSYQSADRVVVLSSDMRERCIEHGVRPERIRKIPNWADTDRIHPVVGPNAFREANKFGDRFLVMYSGNMGLPHLLTPILDAAERLRDRDDIAFAFVGDGVQRADLVRMCEARGLSNVTFLPYQPKETLSHSLSAADIQVISVKPDVIPCLMPSKLYGILAAGSSVLAIAPVDCELSRIVRSYDLGETCDPSPRESIGAELAESIVRLLDRGRLSGIRDRARELAVNEFGRARQVERFRDLLRELHVQPASVTGDDSASIPARECEIAAARVS